MAGGDDEGKVTQRQLFDAILKQNEDRVDDYRTIIGKLDKLNEIVPQVITNKNEIEKLRARSTVSDIAIAIGAAIAAAIAAALGR